MAMPIDAWTYDNDDDEAEDDGDVGGSNISRQTSNRNLKVGNRTPRIATPFKALNARKMNTKKPLSNEERDEFLTLFITHLEEKANISNCVCRTGKKGNLSCNCLGVLKDDNLRGDVASYLLEWGMKPYREQTQVLVDWTRYANPSASNPRCFLLPYVPNANQVLPAGISNHRICVSALFTLMGFGGGRWKTIKYLATAGGDAVHGLEGKGGNRKRNPEGEMISDLRDHFTVLEGFAEPQATRYVREVTGEVTERDNDEKAVYLPTSMSKAHCYRRYCHDRGYKVKTNNKGIRRMEERSDFNGDRKDCIPYTSYMRYWTSEYPHLKVGNPSEDICTYCFMFANRHKYRTNPNRQAEAVKTTVPLTASLGGGEDDVIVTGQSYDQPSLNVDEIAGNPYMEEQEQELLEAARHVRMARVQRKRFQDHIAMARLNPLEVKTLVVDYGQNMQLPWFGANQPGSTYYYTPLNVYNLGIVDVAHNGEDILYCHVYTESEGRKGGDNVASLIMKTLHKLGWIQDGRAARLNIVFDNCPGQNKNNTVIRLVPYLVEMGYFHRVEFMFLVVGHTKNNCDRWFNTLKSKYRKSNVYTKSQLVDVLSTVSRHVQVWTVDEGDFKGYSVFLNRFYRSIPAVTKAHIFVCDGKDPLNTDTKRVMHTYEYDKDQIPDAKEVVFSFIKQGFESRSDYPKNQQGLMEAVSNRELYIKDTFAFIDTYNRIGLNPYKQVELWENYSKVVPEQYCQIICPEPSDDVKAMVKREKEQNRQIKKEKKVAKREILGIDEFI